VTPQFHRPVLLDEALRLLDPRPGGTYLDCTLGGAGHAKALLSRILPGGRLVGIDRDRDAIEHGRLELAEFGGSVTLIQGNFADLQRILGGLSIGPIDGAMFDLGVSSHQLDTAERGFSFSVPAALDMRMDVTQPATAAHLVNRLPERELAALIYAHSDERWARRIARAIVQRRQTEEIRTTTELVEVVVAAIPARSRRGPIHPATRTFQALRIAVNCELESLEKGLAAAAEALKVGGRICAISYHSLEDRIVKRFFALASGRCQCPPGLPECVCGARRFLRVLTKKPVRPTPGEIEANPRSRSAKLRAAERVAATGSGG